MAESTTDRIEKRIVLRAPRARVWRALADAGEFAMTLVTFELADVPEGTLLTVVESGFDRIPPARRAAAFRENEKGWAEQMANIERHVSSRA